MYAYAKKQYRTHSHSPPWWPLHDIVRAITEIVWCIAYKTRVRRGSRILPKNRALVLHQDMGKASGRAE